MVFSTDYGNTHNFGYPTTLNVELPGNPANALLNGTEANE